MQCTDPRTATAKKTLVCYSLYFPLPPFFSVTITFLFVWEENIFESNNFVITIVSLERNIMIIFWLEH